MNRTDDWKGLEQEFADGTGKKIILCIVVIAAFWTVIGITFYYIGKNQTQQYAAMIQEEAKITADDGIPEMVDFDALHKISRDAVAWIYAPDTEINYVIAQTDNNKYYLDNQLNGGFSMGGTLFVNCDNSPDLSDWNTVIYGHYMRNGTMFSSFTNYESQDYYESHPVMYLYTPGHHFRLELIAAYTTWITDTSYDVPETAEGRDKIVANAKEQSMFVSDTTVEKDDKLVTLSTCIDDIFDKTYVVVGKLVEE